MAFELPPLPYAQDALAPHISAETLEYHYGKHHQTYVTNLNKLVEGTEFENASLEDVILKSDGGLFNNSAQVWNHTFYWNSMTPDGGGAPTGEVADAINSAFGSYDDFRSKFAEAATTQFGSGWAWLVDSGSGLEIMKTSNADLPMKHNAKALLTIDVWEHAYYIDFRNARPNYISTFLDSLVNWDFVAQNVAGLDLIIGRCWGGRPRFHSSPHRPDVATPAPAPRLLDPAHRLLLVGVVCLITVVAVESMAISTVMPVVEADLGGLWLYGWVFSGFYLGTLVGVVLGGRAADRTAPVVPMAVGISVFLCGLVVGGLAPEMWVLVAGRVLQGLGAGVVPAVAYVCVGRGFPAELRPKVFAVMSTAWVVPSLVSPLLASEIAESVGWRWVFLGLVPVTVVVALLGVPSVRTVTTPERDESHPRTPLGSVFAIAAGAALVLGGLGSANLALGLPLAVAGVLVAVPAYRVLTPPGTLGARTPLGSAVLTRGVLTCAFFSADAFVSLAMTSVRGTTTRTAGLVLASASLSWTAGSWIQARFAPRWGPARLVRTGGAMLGLGAATMGLSLSGSVPVGLWLLAGAFAGLGMGLAYPQLAVVTLAEAEPGHEGAATSSLQMSDILGIALGTGLAGVLVNLGDRSGAVAWLPLAAVFALSGAVALGVVSLAPRLAAGSDSVSAPSEP